PVRAPESTRVGASETSRNRGVVPQKRQRPSIWPGLPSLFDGGQGGNRTPDTGIFNPLLYRLSYLAARGANSTALRRGRQVLLLRATAPGSPAAERSLRRRRTFPSRLPGTYGPGARSGSGGIR